MHAYIYILYVCVCVCVYILLHRILYKYNVTPSFHKYIMHDNSTQEHEELM